MAYYNEYELIQLKNNYGEPAMPRSTPKAVVFPDGTNLEDKMKDYATKEYVEGLINDLKTLIGEGVN